MYYLCLHFVLILKEINIVLFKSKMELVVQKILKFNIYKVSQKFHFNILLYKGGFAMNTKYKVVEVVENNISDIELKMIINKKIYNIIRIVDLGLKDGK